MIGSFVMKILQRMEFKEISDLLDAAIKFLRTETRKHGYVKQLPSPAERHYAPPRPNWRAAQLWEERMEAEAGRDAFGTA